MLEVLLQKLTNLQLFVLLRSLILCAWLKHGLAVTSMIVKFHLETTVLYGGTGTDMVVVWLYSFSNSLILLIHACLELIFVLVTTNLCNNKLCLGVFYRPPSSSLSVLHTLSDTLFSLEYSLFLNFGDFNVDFSSQSLHHMYSTLSNLMNTFSLTQVVTTPTRICPNGQSSLIDLVFMSSPDSRSLCSSMPCLGSADHQGLCIVVQRAMTTPHTQLGKRTIWRYIYAHADFDHACEMLDFNGMFDTDSVDHIWSCWKTAFSSVMNECIPKPFCLIKGTNHG